MELTRPFADDFNADELTLFSTDYWSVLVRKTQVTIGSLVLAANRTFISASELTPREMREFPEVVGRLEHILSTAFSFDKINYLCLMMVDLHYHFHVIPRYEKPREFRGKEWVDASWPKPPKLSVPPTDKGVLLDLKEYLSRLDK